MQSKKKKTYNSPKRIRVAWTVFGCLWALVILFFTLLSWGWLGSIPSFDQLENPSSMQSSEVLSDDGEILGFIGIENRSDVSYAEISPNVINALIATEDSRFYKHSGIDARSLMRVAVKTVLFRHSSSGGGSTISQQLAKNLFTLEGRANARGKLGTIYYKFKEWVVAVKLERTYSKQEILAMYLNTVDYGSNAFGIKTAAKTFFDKDPSELSVDEAAVLVGLLKAPTAYSPKLHPEHSLERRNTVLARMNHSGFIDDAQCDSLQKLPIDMGHFTPQSHNEGLATYLREYVRNYMKDWCKHHRKPDGTQYDVYKDGLRIYTTIDSRLQAYAEAAVRKHMSEEIQPAFDRELAKRKGNPFVNIDEEAQNRILTQAMKNSDRYYAMKRDGMSDREIQQSFNTPVEMRLFSYRGTIDTTLTPWDSLLYYKKFINAGLVSVEPGTGYVRAYVGGINYRYFKYDNVQSHRQVGSTFKPFVYAMALQDLGMYPCTEVPNSEVCFDMPSGQADWCPKNSSHEREGEMVTLKWALAHSVNWVSAYLLKQGSPEQVVRIARNMGIKSPIDAVPSICVGVPEITVMEMAAAMATFANHGEYVEPIFITKICDSKGIVLETFTPERHTAINEVTAYLMIDMMKGVVQSGTGTRLNYKYHLSDYTHAIAGKTGTTQNNSDCWFMGITPTLATAIWTGGEVRSIHFRNMTYGQGASQALPIFGYYMQSVYRDKTLNFPRGDFAMPADSLITTDCDAFREEVRSENEQGLLEF